MSLVRKVRLPAHAASRCFWLLMIAAHTPALFGFIQSSLTEGMAWDRVGGFAAVGLSVLFFAVKLHSPDFLQFRADRRSLVAMGLIIGLIHLGCLPVEPAIDIPEPLVGWATLSAACGGLAVLAVVRRGHLAATASGSKAPGYAGLIGRVWLGESPSCECLLARAGFLLRAPPSC